MDKKQEADEKHRLLKKHELVAILAVLVAGILIGSFVVAGPRTQA